MLAVFARSRSVRSLVVSRAACALSFAAGVLLAACSSTSSTPSAPRDPSGGVDGGAVADAATSAPDPTRWSAAGSLEAARRAHTATLLRDGRVLVVGGETQARAMLASVEIFDPASGAWTAGPSLPAPRANHVAVLLHDGRVLVAGGGKSTSNGQPSGEEVLATTIVFAADGASFTEVGVLAEGRSHAQAVKLDDGKVLVAGGGADAKADPACATEPCYGRALASAELFDPATGEWSEAGSMKAPRYSFSLTVVGGSALAVGGVNDSGKGLRATERFDASAGAWSAGPELAARREHHAATVDGEGRLVVVGGKTPNVAPLASTEILAADGSSFDGGPELGSPRTVTAVVTLQSGRVLAIGGFDQVASTKGSGGYLTEAVILGDGASEWRPLGAMTSPRIYHSATRLADGRVLVVGGSDGEDVVRAAEIAEP